MAHARKQLGDTGESIALRYLRSKDYEILAQNWRAGHGEIDLIACQGDEVVFVEVKTRRGNSHGTPEESVTATKQRQLRMLVEIFFLRYPHLSGRKFRIDVIAIELAGESGGRLRHLKAVV